MADLMGYNVDPEPVDISTDEPIPEPGMMVGAEGYSKQEQQNPYGPNFEMLPKELQDALRDLVTKFDSEEQTPRRAAIKASKKAREYWKGMQKIYWDDTEGRWSLPQEYLRMYGDVDEEQMPGSDFVVNIFQAFGLSFAAALSQALPTTKWQPQSAKQREDVATANVANDIADLIHHNNDVKQLQKDLAYYFWCDGMVGGYMRYVSDASRWGTHQEPVMQQTMQKMGEDAYSCPNCGGQTPVPDFLGMCSQCGQELGPENLMQSPELPVPTVKEILEVANGQEELTIVGRLELKTPSWAKVQWQFPLLVYETEQHKSKLKATYPHVRDKIGKGITVSSEDTYERTSRLNLTGTQTGGSSNDANNNLITFKRVWLRPWAFYSLEDPDKTSKLLEVFPTGCYCAFAGDVYCEARNETMDDSWRVTQALPGDGQNCPAVGEILLDINDLVNNFINQMSDIYEWGVPLTFMDSRLMDREALKSQTVQAGSVYFLNGKQGLTVNEGVKLTPQAQVPPDMLALLREFVGPLAQFLVGIFPALFGGDTGANDTFRGIALQRDQAMGRIGLIWSCVKRFWSDMDRLGVDCFRKNRFDDVEVPLEGKGGVWESQFIRQADLKGNINAYPDTNEAYPAMWAQQRGIFMDLLNVKDPLVQAFLSLPGNMEKGRNLIGLWDFEIPDEEIRTKQYREIDMMLQMAPTVQPPPMMADPMAPMAQPMVQSSIPVDKDTENHLVEASVCFDWMNSKEGQQVKQENRQGWDNVRAHYMEHLTFQMQQMQQQIMAQAAAAAPPGGDGKSSDTGPGPSKPANSESGNLIM